MVKKKYRRKYLVNGRYQLAQALVAVLANAFAVLLTGALLAWFYLVVWDGSLAVNHNRLIPLYLAGSLTVVVFSSSYFSLRSSRSVAGMMKKLQMVLEDAGRGVLPERQVRFRKSDYFQELEAPLNACLEQLRKKKAAPELAVAGSREQKSDLEFGPARVA